MRRRVALVVAGILLTLTGSLPVGAVDGVEVLATPDDELNPAATADHLSWEVWDGRRLIVFATPDGGPRVRVSPTGWSGANGSIEGDQLVYQQFSPERGESDIYTFDLVTRQRAKVGPPVSTPKWEYTPSRSGDVTAFARLHRNGDRDVVLVPTGEPAQTVASTSGSRVLAVGQVNGDWLVYERAVYRGNQLVSCDVFRHQISTDQTEKIPNPGDKCQYGSSVDSQGTAYYARSGWTCGKNVDIKADPIVGAPTTLTSLPHRRDVYSTYALYDEVATTTDVYYDPARCKPRGFGPGDIYKVTTPTPGP